LWTGDAPALDRRWTILGLVAGFGILARVDVVLLVGVIVLFVLVQHGIRRAARVAIATAAVIAPWWIWCTVNLGTPLPTSGAAVHRQPFVAPWAARIVSIVSGAV